MINNRKITLHHLNQSRSFRILWLLEEMKLPYHLEKYYRDQKTHLAPDQLKNIHPLGKSPVIQLNDKVIAESGAIVEILIQKFAPHLVLIIKMKAILTTYSGFIFQKVLQWCPIYSKSLT